jgi:DNA-binding SARP family transcriptional activator/TolB-like protein
MAGGLHIQLLGTVRVSRDGVEVPLPRSRKVRALLAFLAIEASPKSRSRLCDLLWSVPNDPRGELRWCLSKLRGILDQDGRCRVMVASQSLVSLDLSDCLVDAIEVDRLMREGVDRATTERLGETATRIAGDLLDGLQLDAPELSGWLIAQRQRYRTAQIAILRELVQRSLAGSTEMFRWLDAWLQLTPFDCQPHEALLDALVRCGRPHDAEAHASRTIRAFEQEGLDWAPLRSAWQLARQAATRAPTLSTQVEPPSSAPPMLALPSAVPLVRPGSVVVMPFVATTSELSPVANGLTEDIITRLARLRVLFVIARGTAYVVSDRGLDAREAGRVLNVEYVVSGTVRRQGERMVLHVELAETRDGGIVWADRTDAAVDETLAFVDSTMNRVIAAISEHIEQVECKRAIAKLPSSLDAWDAYHRGLWHMYLFTGIDNDLAGNFFRAALKIDPGFARAHAGLSFTHFQNVFLGLKPERERETALALETAGQSLSADDRDPAAHWAMGRALWLQGEPGEAIAELERSVDLSPSFALGHYTLGFVYAQSGDPQAAIHATDYSRQLSPFDPLQFAMLASRALAHIRLGERDQAAEWAVRATRRPNAHVHILAIAATSLALVNRRDSARALVARIRNRLPDYDVEEFLRAFRFTPDIVKLIRHGARQIGFA